MAVSAGGDCRGLRDGSGGGRMIDRFLYVIWRLGQGGILLPAQRAGQHQEGARDGRRRRGQVRPSENPG